MNRRNVGAKDEALEALQQARRHALAIDVAEGAEPALQLAHERATTGGRAGPAAGRVDDAAGAVAAGVAC